MTDNTTVATELTVDEASFVTGLLGQLQLNPLAANAEHIVKMTHGVSAKCAEIIRRSQKKLASAARPKADGDGEGDPLDLNVE